MEFTVKEFAHRERVDERTVRRWIEKGALAVRRTPGGRVRIMDEQSRAVVFDMANSDICGHSNH
jgi:excisionase family DNA binding protein